MKKLVTIGGGTGSYTLLRGLKKLSVDLTAIVNVTDTGGSTGRLRDEFGYLPVGDFRMALCALADANGESDLLRDLFLYRFEKGEQGLRGHNFGNLFLTALTDIMGSEDAAFGYAAKILRIKGKVVPISHDDSTLVAEYEDGEVLMGESYIDAPNKKHDGKKRIKKLFVQPAAQISPKAKKAIKEADVIILGPGDLYTSTLANIVVDGTGNLIKKSSAKLIYIVNLMTKWGQTYGFTARDHVEEIKKYVGKYPDVVLLNKKKLPEDILRRYKKEHDFPVIDDLENISDYKIIRGDFLAREIIKKSGGDAIKRSLIRHDSEKLAKIISSQI